MTSARHENLVDQLDQINLLRKYGYNQLIDVLYEEKSFTKKGRINKSAVCRALGCKGAELAIAMELCRGILLGGKEEEVENTKGD